MFLKDYKTQTKFLLITSILLVLGIIISPYSSLDIFLLAILLFFLGNYLLKEKLLLIILILRPTLDWWRDVTIFHYEKLVINLNAALSIFVLFWLIWLIIKEYKKWEKIPNTTSFFLLIAWTALTTLWSVSQLTTLEEVIKLANWGLFFVAGYLLVKNKKITLNNLLTTGLLSAIIPGLIGLWQLISSSGLSTFGLHGRIYGTFGHPNVFALFFLFLLFIFIQNSKIKPLEFWEKQTRYRKLTWILLLVLIIMTYTRVAVIGLLVFLIILGIFSYRKILIFLIGLFAIYYIIFFPVNNWLITNYQISLTDNPITSRFTTVDEDSDSIAWRLALIRESEPLIRAKLLSGYGFGTFEAVWGDNRPITHLWDDSAEAHNDYLRLALETGLIGLGLYLILLSNFALNAFQLMKKQGKENYLYFFAWIITFMIVSLSDNLLHHTPVIWLTMAIWGGILGQEKNKEKINFLEK